MPRPDPLKVYRSKRNFHRTPEPPGAPRASRARRSRKPAFVIQEHAARTLHYDFRLEVDGVLKSWAVPKGPSTNPKEKRLAMATEDHPLEYATFEGVIPEGEYGAGTIIVWDSGTYRNLARENGQDPTPVERTLRQGHVSVWLEGKKLHGGYTLTRIGKAGAKKRGGRWLLVKKNDEEADARFGSARRRAGARSRARTIARATRRAAEVTAPGLRD